MPADLRFLRALAARWARPLFAGAAVMVVESSFVLAVPWIVGMLTSVLFGRKGPWDLGLPALFVLLLGAFAAQALCSLVHQRTTARVFSEIVTSLRISLYEHLQSLSYQRRTELPSGDASTLLGRDAQDASQFVSDFLSGLFPTVLTAGTTIALLITISPLHGVAVAVAVPAYLVLVKLTGRRFGRLSSDLATARAEANAVADDQLRLWQIARAFAVEPFMVERYRRLEERVRRYGEMLQRSVAALHPLTQLAAVAGVLALVWPMSGRVLEGTLSPDAFIRFLLYALVLSRTVGALAGLYGSLQRARGSAGRLAAVFEQLPERRSGIAIPKMSRSIALSNLTFAYGGRAPVFDGVDLTIRQGELVIVTGPNGSGKSTLVKLLLGLLDPSSGRIAIDGVDISSASLSSLRQQFAWVPQDTLLLRGTVRENIVLGRDVPSDALDRALDQSKARAVVSALPGGLDALIGEGGVNLSGGERQRIALARALMSDHPVLLLDEATSMIDLVTEAELIARLEAFSGVRTVLLVSHRVPRLSVPHRILTIRNRRIVEAPPVSVVA